MKKNKKTEHCSTLRERTLLWNTRDGTLLYSQRRNTALLSETEHCSTLRDGTLLYSPQSLCRLPISSYARRPPNGPAGLRGETTTDDPERGGASGVQTTEKGTRHPATHRAPLAASSCSHSR